MKRAGNAQEAEVDKMEDFIEGFGFFVYLKFVQFCQIEQVEDLGVFPLGTPPAGREMDKSTTAQLTLRPDQME